MCMKWEALRMATLNALRGKQGFCVQALRLSIYVANHKGEAYKRPLP